MLRTQPFRAVRPRPDCADQVASVPYDVVSTQEARALAEGNPLSFLRIVRAELELPDTTNPYADDVYDRARSNFQKLRDDGVLITDDQPQLYLYRLTMGTHVQTGVVTCCHIDDYLNDVIRKHEKTRRDKEDDRTRHVLELNAHAEPVFLTCADNRALAAAIERDTRGTPLYDFTADADGPAPAVRHTVWAVDDAQPYVDAFAEVPAAYIADGHHRSASAVRAGTERREANPDHTGNEAYNWFLAVLFPASQLQILPYNRVVTDLNDLDPQHFLDRLTTVGTVSRTDNPRPATPGRICIYVAGHWHELVIDPSMIDRTSDIKSLDVTLLQEHVLTPILGIGDIRADKRIDFVGGVRGTEELERRVDAGEAAVAFSMYPTSIEQLIAVSDAGAIMPPKSTWFEPKIRSGLVTALLD